MHTCGLQGLYKISTVFLKKYFEKSFQGIAVLNPRIHEDF